MLESLDSSMSTQSSLLLSKSMHPLWMQISGMELATMAEIQLLYQLDLANHQYARIVVEPTK
jgi:hypothetical protein